MAYCSGICRNNLPCQHGGYPHPNSCTKCICPTGLGGTYCDQVQASNCGTELPMAAASWNNLSYSGASSCYWRVRAPTGQRIRFELTYVYFKCAPTCEEFVEIKYGISHDRTGFRQCCRAEYGEVVSHGNSILILTHATRTSQFVLRYRAEGTFEATPLPVVGSSSGEWTVWSTWTTCSERCGACGVRTRRRKCIRETCHGTPLQTQVCNLEGCPPGTPVAGRRYAGYRTGNDGSNRCCTGYKLSGYNGCMRINK
ncbi:thrombospondin type 1 domain protein [Necator americanus]|uniref:Thrombospondin type 1 domain protein n=1 Tax=Necator americanus TaxID=51031 RepID=W2TU77_NECAM|nr:thrombospondin type 1 domain protein [Necator americanus]ETN85645.1 thrombospondin type 1 domain protein [Necator americanus]